MQGWKKTRCLQGAMLQGYKVCEVTRLARLLGLEAYKACKDGDFSHYLSYRAPTTESDKYFYCWSNKITVVGFGSQ